MPYSLVHIGRPLRGALLFALLASSAQAFTEFKLTNYRSAARPGLVVLDGSVVLAGSSAAKPARGEHCYASDSDSAAAAKRVADSVRASGLPVKHCESRVISDTAGRAVAETWCGGVLQMRHTMERVDAERERLVVEHYAASGDQLVSTTRQLVHYTGRTCTPAPVAGPSPALGDAMAASAKATKEACAGMVTAIAEMKAKAEVPASAIAQMEAARRSTCGP